MATAETTRSERHRGPGASDAGGDGAVPDRADAGGDLCALFHDERMELMGMLTEAHAILTRKLGADLEESAGLPLGWFDVMVCLRRSPEGHLTMSELAGRVLLTSGGITRLIDRMAEAGYVERQSCPSDRRAIHVVLTGAGTDTLNGAISAHLASLERHLVAPLDPAERAALASILAKLVGADGG
ncbi:MAG TPA: MarR family transcriptional regulator [Acidimicrobiales bacterium]|nr:MarR family transcriptional regulator [Acidimicrobiales bacterium]